MHQKDEIVTILNQNINGMTVVEGDAVLISYIDTQLYIGIDGTQYFLEYWKVKFNDGRIKKRWLHPQCDIDVVQLK